MLGRPAAEMGAELKTNFMSVRRNAMSALGVVHYTLRYGYAPVLRDGSLVSGKGLETE